MSQPTAFVPTSSFYTPRPSCLAFPSSHAYAAITPLVYRRSAKKRHHHRHQLSCCAHHPVDNENDTTKQKKVQQQQQKFAPTESETLPNIPLPNNTEQNNVIENEATKPTKPKKREMSAESRAKISAALKGRRKSPAHRENLRKRLSGQKNPMYGRKLSAESRAKISQAMTARRRRLFGEKVDVNKVNQNRSKHQNNDVNVNTNDSDNSNNDNNNNETKGNSKIAVRENIDDFDINDDREYIGEEENLARWREKAQTSRLLQSFQNTGGRKRPQRPRKDVDDQLQEHDIDNVLERVARFDEPPENIARLLHRTHFTNNKYNVHDSNNNNNDDDDDNNNNYNNNNNNSSTNSNEIDGENQNSNSINTDDINDDDDDGDDDDGFESTTRETENSSVTTTATTTTNIDLNKDSEAVVNLDNLKFRPETRGRRKRKARPKTSPIQKEFTDCDQCSGSGLVSCPKCVGSLGVVSSRCPSCFGAGCAFCPKCDGSGSLSLAQPQ